jgi:two-component system, response regulator YesN
MIKILLIDDEVMIRKGIRTSIDWESYGMVIIGEASNGKEGLEKAFELKPDIILIDVRMPVMDGLEFTKIIKQRTPEVRTIIISGYDDFKYAREALHLGVNEYLLKPVGAEELVNILQRQCEEIVKERDELNKEKAVKNVFEENLFYMQSRFMKSIIKREYINESYLYEKSKKLQIELPQGAFQVIIIDIDDFYLITENQSDKEEENLRLLVKSVAEEVLMPLTNSIVFLYESDYLVTVVDLNDVKDSCIYDLYQEIRNRVKKYQKLTVTIGISNKYVGISKISDAYNEAALALRSKIFKGKDRIIDINLVHKANKTSPIIYLSSDEKEILGCLRTMEIGKLNKAIEKICQDLIVREIDDVRIREICLRQIIISASYLDEIGVDYRNYNGKEFDPYTAIQKYETLKDIEDWLKNVFNNFIKAMQDSKNEKFKGIVKVAMQYINENYQEEINVLKMADITYVTPNYFSRVFNKETGKSFTEWLNMVRVDKAKELLKNPKWRVYEIAEKVGYKDYKSFIFNFKKYSGCTPKEYHERNMT